MNVMKVVKVGQTGEAAPESSRKGTGMSTASGYDNLEELRQQANNGDALACLYLGQLGRKQGE